MIKIDFTKETITIFMINKSSIYDAVEYILYIVLTCKYFIISGNIFNDFLT